MAALGAPPMPWQSHVVDVALEADPDTGRLVYPVVVVTVPRRAGKTTLTLGRTVWRCLHRPGQRVWYTAQTGQAARDRWLDLVKQVKATPLRRVVEVKRTNGSESMEWVTGSTLRPFPPQPDALHGNDVDDATVDEAWAHTAGRGLELEQAIIPAMGTRPGAQLWVVSTAGTAASTWLRSYIDRGRAGAPGIAYFEWSIADDVDPADVAAVAAAHPAVGYTMPARAVADAAAAMTPGEFARAYGNRWTVVLDLVFPVADWAACADLTTHPPDTPVLAFGADVAIDRSSAAIVALTGGVLEVVDERPGTAWLGPRLAQLAGAHAAPICVDAAGPAATVADELSAARTPRLMVPSVREYVTGCQDFYDAVMGHRLRVRPHESMDAAAAAATQRPVGDAWVWGRRRSTGSIAPLVAATLARWAAGHAKPADPRPQVRAG